MSNGETKASPTVERIQAYLTRIYGEDFKPEKKQTEWLQKNWNRTDVSKEEWEAVLPSREKEVDGVKYVLQYGHYGTWTSAEGLTLEQWARVRYTGEPSEEEVQLIEAIEKAQKKKQELFTPIMDIPEPEWLIEGFVVREGITLLYGDRSAGKTSLMLQLIGCAIERKRLFGLQSRQIVPLLIEQDENPSLLRGHIERMLPVYPSLGQLQVPQEPILWDNKEGNFANIELFNDFILYSGLANLVVIDSLTSLGIEDITLPKCSIVFDKLRTIAANWRCAFIVIHHPNMKGEVMGSKLIQAKVDVILHLHDKKISIEKLRGKTPETASVDNNAKYPYFKVEQDKETLVFRIDRAEFIRAQLKQGKQKQDVVEEVLRQYGVSKESARKAVERGIDKSE